MKRVEGSLAKVCVPPSKDEIDRALDVLRKHVITKCPNAMLAGLLHKALNAMENLR